MPMMIQQDFIMNILVASIVNGVRFVTFLAIFQVHTIWRNNCRWGLHLLKSVKWNASCYKLQCDILYARPQTMSYTF
ncbi:hypothetical protein SERLA73DRAFT_173684 [Serpula lacrymans var. lacrymans S7.3]|uniref:Uncharacterized protein n=2 Tax=Serpula lacrymans var. lacrymans TaxID=341189 RepID=F8PFQ1_SERL3|nr:uncharacterized protein SERLADRAFT_454502 [Serpula lacrymans var. lacrymans S7.9]EGO04252.1 hypothetical protein SERLA73DRAFT_173684 [Serpula lacrymans var. lacrymans S7.3]EGO30187.1 hypothetical protein SERLADRAFT_454502 [Serpula lacrymans var. lacrymans S7.9]